VAVEGPAFTSTRHPADLCGFCAPQHQSTSVVPAHQRGICTDGSQKRATVPSQPCLENHFSQCGMLATSLRTTSALGVHRASPSAPVSRAGSCTVACAHHADSRAPRMVHILLRSVKKACTYSQRLDASVRACHRQYCTPPPALSAVLNTGARQSCQPISVGSARTAPQNAPRLIRNHV
jgi:hypothetical protein